MGIVTPGRQRRWFKSGDVEPTGFSQADSGQAGMNGKGSPVILANKVRRESTGEDSGQAGMTEGKPVIPASEARRESHVLDSGQVGMTEATTLVIPANEVRRESRVLDSGQAGMTGVSPE
jgi:hypothetical protein